MSAHKIICGKAEEMLQGFEDNTFDLVIADPPYFKVMVNDYKGNKHEWDNQWHSFDEYLNWCQLWLSDIYRILKKNGSVYIFGDDKNIVHIQVLREKYEELRRYFNPTKNYTDVWKIPIVGGKETNNHPTQKPLKLIERIIRVSSREGDTILVPFMGSGTDLVAAERLGCNSIGIEISKEYCELAFQRLKNEVGQTRLGFERSTIEKIGF